MKKITILGSTGSIGTQTLDVIRENPDRFQVEALTCRKNTALLAEQIREFHPRTVAVLDPEAAAMLSVSFPDVQVLSGTEGLVYAASQTDSDLVLNSLVGMSGLVPTFEAIRQHREIALANKETLVAGGSVIMQEAASRQVRILPVDSEHSAIYQSMLGYSRDSVKRILLTASGGPFRGMTPEQLKDVTLEQALAHPNWSMGKKITIDSATMMNKGFEIIEARWLFDIPADRIDVVIHPESIIHSMVEYEDHAVIAQLGLPDMRIPISFALNGAERLADQLPSLDLTTLGRLTFEAPDPETFRCLKLAGQALEAGGTYCTALNAANEVCVRAFLERRIGFPDIQHTLEEILDRHKPLAGKDLEEILSVDRLVRAETEAFLQKTS